MLYFFRKIIFSTTFVSQGQVKTGKIPSNVVIFQFFRKKMQHKKLWR